MIKIAKTREELEACFRLLHDAYVASGFQQPHPSGMRATLYHALPTTTTLCAMHKGEVVGTMSLIRENPFGFPMQSIFDLQDVRAKGGNIAEVSALAVHPRYRHASAAVLFPMMKFMHEYCTTFFDTQHLIIAVNPSKIELYESLFLFDRLAEKQVDNYDFVNGAPAVGASLDLRAASEKFKQAYGKRNQKRNLHSYFTERTLPKSAFPNRPYFTTNDPVMTPELLDYFFNQRMQVFCNLDNRKKVLLHGIYDTPDYAAVLPPIDETLRRNYLTRQHPRYALKCPGLLRLPEGTKSTYKVRAFKVVEVSMQGFQASSGSELPLNVWCDVSVQLGHDKHSRFKALALRKSDDGKQSRYAFKLDKPDLAWYKLVTALQWGQTCEDLQHTDSLSSITT